MPHAHTHCRVGLIKLTFWNDGDEDEEEEEQEEGGDCRGGGQVRDLDRFLSLLFDDLVWLKAINLCLPPKLSGGFIMHNVT